MNNALLAYYRLLLDQKKRASASAAHLRGMCNVMKHLLTMCNGKTRVGTESTLTPSIVAKLLVWSPYFLKIADLGKTVTIADSKSKTHRSSFADETDSTGGHSLP